MFGPTFRLSRFQRPRARKAILRRRKRRHCGGGAKEGPGGAAGVRRGALQTARSRAQPPHHEGGLHSGRKPDSKQSVVVGRKSLAIQRRVGGRTDYLESNGLGTTEVTSG